MVISDVQFLKTLPKRELICGYGEILKHSLIANKKFYNFLDKNSDKILKLSSPYIEKAIYESCKIKKNVVEKYEKEKGIRKILNFGHTFEHAYEASLGYSKKLNHGKAVILGMQSTLSISLKNNLIKKNDYYLVLKHISETNLPSKLKKFFKNEAIKKKISYRIIVNKNSLGAGYARNVGIKKSKTKYIAFLDSDDMWSKNKLKIQIDYMENLQP